MAVVVTVFYVNNSIALSNTIGQSSSDGVPDMTALSDLDVRSINENLG